ncbi:MAG TPA: hypothetical protein VEU51_17375 [Candidatus Acidoferrales bacterium]|nr:hypothetical protein [Candidatus Acidoferrales bacterium]
MDARTNLKAEGGDKMQEKETLDERLPGLFEPDTLLPIQYFEAMRKKHLLEGEKRLILSVLEDAIECFMKCIDASTSKGQRLFRDADEWIAHEDKRWVFSFDNVCDMLDINPEYMRMGLAKWKEKRLDAIARRRAALVLEAERAAAEAALHPEGVAAPVVEAAAAPAAIRKPVKVAAKPVRVKRREERARHTKRPARKLRKARA